MELSLRNFSKYHIDMVVREGGKGPCRITAWYGEATKSLRYRTWDMGHGTLRGSSRLIVICRGSVLVILMSCCKGKSKWDQMIGRCGKLTSLGKWLMCVSCVTLVISDSTGLLNGSCRIMNTVGFGWIVSWHLLTGLRTTLL